MIRLLCVLLLGLIPLQTLAMEVRPGKPGLCVATLSGEIGPGDAARLQAHDFGDPPTEEGWEYGEWKALCLESPGGQLSEALKMARYVVDNDIGTVVDAGAECLSACALLFMFGQAYQIESNSVTNRRLHVRGRLGFHQPELLLDETRAYSVDDVRAAYTVAIEATLRLLALAARPRPDSVRPYIDSDLQEAMLQHKGQDFYVIDSVNKAGRWDIALFGFTPPNMNESALLYACQNMTSWPAQLSVDQVTYDKKDFDVFFSREAWPESDLKSPRVSIEFAGMQIHECHMGLVDYWTGEELPVLCGEYEALNAFVGPDDCRDPSRLWRWQPIPDWALFPADTPLSSLR